MEQVKSEVVLHQFAPLLLSLFEVTVDGEQLSDGAKIVYSVLLGRRGISEKNGWADEIGIYVIYPVEELAADVQKKKRTILSILDTLERAGLIHRKRMGFPSANRIYVFLPEVQEAAPIDRSAGNCTYEVQNSAPMRCEKMHPKRKYTKEKQRRCTHPAVKHRYGEFKNVLLTENEYQQLGECFSDRDSRIEDLSYYIGSHGDKYKSHYRTILTWARNETKRKQAAQPAGEELEWLV